MPLSDERRREIMNTPITEENSSMIDFMGFDFDPEPTEERKAIQAQAKKESEEYLRERHGDQWRHYSPWDDVRGDLERKIERMDWTHLGRKDTDKKDKESP